MLDPEWRSLVEQAEEALLQAECAEPATANHLFDEAEAKAKLVTETRPNCATGHHLLALCWYMRPDCTVERNAKIDAALAKAYELNPEDLFVIASLAYQAFDNSDFEVASRWLQMLPRGSFAARGQIWRDLKHEELRLCCDLRRGIRVDEPELREFFGACHAAQAEDLPMPTELVQTTVRLGGEGEAKHLAREVLRLLEAKELAGTFGGDIFKLRQILEAGG
ncbi:MAG: hypothetical protein K8T91_20380 [Planctomycetes bacterium]|nr:hypothetical protein [Planctomycetota bacterium]